MSRLSLHKISNPDNVPFCTRTYSMFKYGCKTANNEFAYALYKNIIQQRCQQLIQESSRHSLRFGVCGAPYNWVNVASSNLAARIAYYQFSYPCFLVKVTRQHSYHDDYGMMSKEDRDKSLSGESFSIENNEYFHLCDHIFFIDDIYVTGAHERRMLNLIESNRGIINSFDLVYYAELVDSGCCPTLEGRLNSEILQTRDSVVQFFSESEILFNTRNTKYLLSIEPNTLREIIITRRRCWRNDTFAKELLNCARANSYYLHPKYKVNFHLVNRFA